MPLTLEEKRELASLENIEARGKRGGVTKTIKLTPEEEVELAELERIQKVSKLEPILKELRAVPEELYRAYKTTGETASKEAQAGLQMMKEAITKPSLKSAYQLPLGAAQYTLSPIAGVAKGFAGQPTQRGLEKFGVKPEVAEFISKFPEEALYFMPFEWFGLPMRAGKTLGLKAAEKMKKVSKATKIPIMPKEGELQLPKVVIEEAPKQAQLFAGHPLPKAEVPKSIQEALKGTEQYIQPAVRDEIVDKITKASEAILAGKPDESKRIFERIREHLSYMEVQIEDIPDILKKHNITPREFANFYASTVSSGGRILAYHSRVSKRLKKIFKNEPDALAILDKAYKKELDEGSLFDTISRKMMGIENVRRAALVGQTATAMRNNWSQLGRITLSGFDEALQTTILGAGKGSMIKQIHEDLNIFTKVYRRISPKSRKILNAVLEENAAAIEKARLFSQPVHEVTMGGRYSKLVNTLNRAQEFYYRRLAFEAKLRKSLSEKGLKFETIDPKKIDLDDIKKATEYALEMTFAASGKGALRSFVRAWSRVGLTVVQPFPRFAYANAIPFIAEHSPYGLLRAFSPKTIEALAGGNPERFAKAASRGVIGTLLFNTAWNIRQSKHAGERYYEYKTWEDPKTGKSKVIDMRPYAPLTTYLFLAEMFLHPERIKGTDIASAMIGLNRIAGSGLALVDLFRTKKKETAFKTITTVAGEYMGGFSVPARTIKDILAEVRPEEASYREKRYSSLPLRFAAPFIQNFPIVSELLPESVSPLKRGSEKAEKWFQIGGVELGPIIRQTTGISGKYKPYITREIDKLGIDYSRIYPKSGSPEADRELSKYMAPMVDNVAQRLFRNKKWRELSREKKTMFLVGEGGTLMTPGVAGIFPEIRAIARLRLMAEQPELFAKVQWEGVSDNMRDFLEKEAGFKFRGLKKSPLTKEESKELRELEQLERHSGRK